MTKNPSGECDTTATFPLLNLIQALERRDEDRVWDLYRVARDRPQFLDWLANWCGMRVATRRVPGQLQQPGTWVHVLFAVPIVAGPSSVFSKDACPALAEAIRTWFGEGHEVILTCGLSKYTSVARWSPLTQKERIAELCGTPFAEPAKWIPNLEVVDADLPAFDLVLGTVGTRAGAPEFPEGGHGLKDRLLQQEIAFATLGRCAAELDDHVGRVAPFADAIQAGLSLWIDSVARSEIVRTWSIEPLGLDVLVLDFHGVEDQCWRLPVRLHQIGLHGVDLLVEQLARKFGPPFQAGHRAQ